VTETLPAPAPLHFVWHKTPLRLVVLVEEPVCSHLPPTLQSLPSRPRLSGLGLRTGPPRSPRSATLSPRPSIAAAPPHPPHPQHPVRLRLAPRAGRAAAPGDPVRGLTCSSRASRRPATAGGGLPPGAGRYGFAGALLRAVGSRGRTGRGGAGRGRKRRRRDYETRPSWSRAHSSPLDCRGTAPPRDAGWDLGSPRAAPPLGDCSRENLVDILEDLVPGLGKLDSRVA
jgi:hypothetical protein